MSIRHGNNRLCRVAVMDSGDDRTMSVLDRIRDRLETPTYSFEQGYTHEAECPICQHWTGVTVPTDAPPNGQHKCTTWCTWCGREFIFKY